MRKDWNEFFLSMTILLAEQATCVKRNVGALAVKNKRILSTGYNGAPSGVDHCTKDTCLRKDVPSGSNLDICMATHAEANVIASAAFHGISLKGATLYCTTKPCLSCCKLLINAGINKVYYLNGYEDDITERYLVSKGHIELIHFNKDV